MATPALADTSTITVAAGSFLSYTYALDVGSDPVTSWSFTTLPDGLSGDAGTGLISGVCNTPGFYSFLVQVCNGSDCRSYTATLLITGGTGVPIANAGADFTVEENGLVSIRPTWSGGVPNLWTWSSLPPGLSFDPSTGVVTGRPTAAGAYAPSVSASNGSGTGPSDSVTITVSAAYVGEGDPASTIDGFIELTTGELTTGLAKLASGAIWQWTYGDDKLLNLAFTRKGVVVEVVLTALKLALKSDEREAAIFEAGGTEDDARWHDVGTGATAAFRFIATLTGAALSAAIDEAEGKGKGVETQATRLACLGQFEWKETNAYDGPVGPDPLRGSTLPFRIDILRDLVVNA